MTPTTETTATAIDPTAILKTVLKQKQKVMDLETGNEGAEIELVYPKYLAPEYDATKFPGTAEEFEKAVLENAMALVSPISEQIKSFLNYATSAGYQTAKTAALATGNYLSSDLKARIIQVMRGNQAFAELPAKECYDRWKAGFMAKKVGAFKVLETAKALGDFGDDL